MSFDPDVAAVMVVPVAVDPVGMGVWWFHIVPGNPDVPFAIPAVVACVPCPVGVLMWRGRDDFVRTRRRSDTDDDLGLGNACGEEKGTGKCREEFLHCAISLSY